MNKTRFALLGLLAERPYSGYELKQVVELRFALFWKESYGQIYPELKRLEAEGLVGSGVEGPRGKRTFLIQEPGRKALAGWLEQDADEDQVRSELLLKLYFAAFTGEDVRTRHLEAVRDRGRRNIAWLVQAEAQLASLVDEDPTHPHALAVVRLGLATERAQLAWAEAELGLPG